jgi:hypothetical protein
VTISGNSVKVPITVKAPITVKVSFAKSFVEMVNVASNVICAKNSPVDDVNNASLPKEDTTTYQKMMCPCLNSEIDGLFPPFW